MHGPCDLRRLPDTGVVTVRAISLCSCWIALCSARDRVARKTKLRPKKKNFLPPLTALSKLRKTGSFDKVIRTSTISRHRLAILVVITSFPPCVIMVEDQAHHGTEMESIRGRCTYILIILYPALTVEWRDVLVALTIDMLPDVALLRIFDFYVDEAELSWHALVHVFRQWRNVVFGSPRRLGLKILCTASTPVRKMLDIWPLFPIVIKAHYYGMWGVHNIIAALKHNDRICQLDLFHFPNAQFKKVLAVMQRPFPTLTDLRLWPEDGEIPYLDVPASFLGGSALHLQTLSLNRIPFPELPKLLLSATHLVTLSLQGILRSGYISPEKMFTCLSVLTKLETLTIGFANAESFPRQRSRLLPLPTRSLLPVLSRLWFEGVSDYLEDLVARVDAPLLHKFDAIFFNQLISDTPLLTQFINCSPKLRAYDKAHVFFSGSDLWVILSQTFNRECLLRISCRSSLDEHALSLVQICGSSFPPALIAAVDHLCILITECWDWRPEDNIGNHQWLELLRSFPAVKNLYIALEFIPSILLILQDLVGERVTEVLPALQTLFLEDSMLFPCPSGVQDVISGFLDARQLSGHPITVSPWQVGKGTEPVMMEYTLHSRSDSFIVLSSDSDII